MQILSIFLIDTNAGRIQSMQLKESHLVKFRVRLALFQTTAIFHESHR